jgi:formate-dependent nitrite reductase membrane component NrfD
MSEHNGHQGSGRGGIKMLSPDSGGPREARGGLAGEQNTYYDLPLVKRAHWRWEIVTYFFLGGTAGGAYLAATLADLFGSREQDKQLIRLGRYIALVGMILSPIMLIKDLGRPARFLHMLRILKFRSVMSMGTWALTVFGVLSGLTASHQMAQDGLLNWLPAKFIPRLLKALPIKLIESIGSIFGLFVAMYTGVLLAATAIPLWGRSRRILGPLFLTSGLSTGLAAISLFLSPQRKQQASLERLETAENIAATVELGLIAALIPTLGPLGKPLFKGKIGRLFTSGTIGSGLILPLLIRLLWHLSGRKPSAATGISASLLTLAGGYILRHAWIHAGRASAADPDAVHYYNEHEWKGKQ